MNLKTVTFTDALRFPHVWGVDKDEIGHLAALRRVGDKLTDYSTGSEREAIIQNAKLVFGGSVCHFCTVICKRTPL